MHESYVRAQTISSLKNEIKALKKEAGHQQARVRDTDGKLKIQTKYLANINRSLRAYRRELHRRRAKNGKKHKK